MGWVELIRREVDKTLPPRDQSVPQVPQHSAAAFRRLVPTKVLPNHRAFPPGRNNVMRAPQPTPNASSSLGAPLYQSASVKAVQLQRQRQAQQQAQQARQAQQAQQTRQPPKKSGCSSCASKRVR
jgi:hypothetical protein